MIFIDKCNKDSPDGSSLEITDKVDDADFVILHGVDVIRGPDTATNEESSETIVNETDLGNFHETEDYSMIDPILEQCSKRNLQLVCANPDFIMIKPDGSIGHMPGKILKRYTDKYQGTAIARNRKLFGKSNQEIVAFASPSWIGPNRSQPSWSAVRSYFREFCLY